MNAIFTRKKEFPHYIVVEAGPTRVGKSTIMDILDGGIKPDGSRSLEPLRGDFERGEKRKYRFRGGAWPSDNERKDSIVIETEEYLEHLRKSGQAAFEYTTVDTTHVVMRNDAERTDKHIGYISDSHRGAMYFKQFFHSRNPIMFLVYTHPRIIEARLRVSDIPQAQIDARLQTFEDEFARFQQNSEEYLFLISSRSPPIDHEVYLDEIASERRRQETQHEAGRVSFLIDKYVELFKPTMNYADIHRAYVDQLAFKLVNSPLADLEARLADGGEIKIDLKGEVESYSKGRYVPREVLEALNNVEVQQYFYENGRHSILLKGFSDPFNSTSHYSPEDTILALIIQKLNEKPRELRNVKEQNYSQHSNHGFFTTLNGGLFKDGVVYSLGNQLLDDAHLSLHIGFVYSKDGQSVQVKGYTMEDIRRLERRDFFNRSGYAALPDEKPNGTSTPLHMLVSMR